MLYSPVPAVVAGEPDFVMDLTSTVNPAARVLDAAPGYEIADVTIFSQRVPPPAYYNSSAAAPVPSTSAHLYLAAAMRPAAPARAGGGSFVVLVDLAEFAQATPVLGPASPAGVPACPLRGPPAPGYPINASAYFNAQSGRCVLRSAQVRAAVWAAAHRAAAVRADCERVDGAVFRYPRRVARYPGVCEGTAGVHWVRFCLPFARSCAVILCSAAADVR